MRDRGLAGPMSLVLLALTIPLVLGAGVVGCGGSSGHSGGGGGVVVTPSPTPSPSSGGPTITTLSGNGLNSGFVGVAYSEGPSSGYFGVTGGTSPITWTATGLPPGLTIDSNGNVTGTPTATGNYSPTLTVTDGVGRSNSQGFLLEIRMQVTISPASAAAGTVGTPYTLTFTASGGVAPYTWTETLPTLLPPGITFNAATATLSGTPTTSGTFNCNVKVVDSTGQNGFAINGNFVIN